MSDTLELESLLAPQEPEQPTQEQESDLIQAIGTSLVNLQDVISKQHFAIHHHEERIAMLEKYISYLLSKDPDMKDKMKAMADAHEHTKE